MKTAFIRLHTTENCTELAIDIKIDVRRNRNQSEHLCYKQLNRNDERKSKQYKISQYKYFLNVLKLS